MTAEEAEKKKSVKRTRICGPQSKNGCFTCKDRRIKCDEGKPTCMRCVRSGRECEGYPARATNTEVSVFNYTSDSPRRSFSTSLHFALSDRGTRGLEQDGLARLGCSVLNHGTNGQLRFAIIDVLLPQLSHAIPTVNAAAAALGAIMIGDELLAAKYYGAVLGMIKQDLLMQTYGTIPSLLAIVLMALSEVLMGYEQNALCHLQGAFKLITNRQVTEHQGISETPPGIEAAPQPPEDDITTLFRTLDLQTCSYALSRSNDMPTNMVYRSLPLTMDVSSARTYLISMVHATYALAAEATKYKYCPQNASSDLVLEQGRHIGALSQWLEIFNRDLSSSGANGLVLRMTCLSALVWIASVLQPFETAYDLHEKHFALIVSDGRCVVDSGDRSDSKHTLPDGRLSLGPGIIQPLFLTALKSRTNPSRRRDAIKLMKNAGREGPWNGPTEALVAERAMENEENWANNGTPEAFTGLIPEQGRIHGCNMEVFSRENHLLKVNFSRCRDVGAMVSAASKGPAEDEDLDGRLRRLKPPHEEEANWELWDEIIPFGDRNYASSIDPPSTRQPREALATTMFRVEHISPHTVSTRNSGSILQEVWRLGH